MVSLKLTLLPGIETLGETETILRDVSKLVLKLRFGKLSFQLPSFGVNLLVQFTNRFSTVSNLYLHQFERGFPEDAFPVGVASTVTEWQAGWDMNLKPFWYRVVCTVCFVIGEVMSIPDTFFVQASE